MSVKLGCGTNDVLMFEEKNDLIPSFYEFKTKKKSQSFCFMQKENICEEDKLETTIKAPVVKIVSRNKHYKQTQRAKLEFFHNLNQKIQEKTEFLLKNRVKIEKNIEGC